MLAATALAGCAAQPQIPAQPCAIGAVVQSGVLPTVSGDGSSLCLGSKATVWYFTGPECPIARSYAPDVARLSEADRARGIEWIMVFPEDGITNDLVNTFRADYALPLPFVLAPGDGLCCDLGVKSIPSVVVIDARGHIIYRGRIDNRYRGIGTTFGPPSEHDLRAMTDALAAGQPVTPRETTAVGCILAPCKTHP